MKTGETDVTKGSDNLLSQQTRKIDTIVPFTDEETGSGKVSYLQRHHRLVKCKQEDRKAQAFFTGTGPSGKPSSTGLESCDLGSVAYFL